MKLLTTTIMFMMLVGSFAFGAPVRRLYQPVALPHDSSGNGQEMIEHYLVTPIAASTNYVLLANAGPISAAVTVVSSFSHQPDVPRNLTITPGSTTGDVESCIVTVSGTSAVDKAISETFTFAADASTAQTGSKAFKTVSSASWAASCESGGFAATWTIGVGEKIGLPRCMANNYVIQTNVGSTIESTRPTVAFSAAAVESNTLDFNGTMNGSNIFDVFFIQNFNSACFP